MSEPETPRPPVLVADDDPVSRRLMRAFLEQANYAPILSENGLGAIETLVGISAPRIAILDWMMPDITGPEVCTRIREAKLDVDPYLIVLTSKRDKAELAQALNAGADDFLTKPFNAVELAARLKVAERAVQRQASLQAEIERLRDGRKEDPEYIELIRGAVADAADRLGLGAPEAVQGDGVHDHVVWTAILFTEHEAWLDLLTEVVPVGGTHDPELAWQVHQAMVDAIRLEHGSIITPLPTKTVAARQNEAARHHGFSVRGSVIRVTSLRSECALHRLSVPQLRPGDVLAEAYPPATRQEVPLLKRGATLNGRIIERLEEYAQTVTDVAPVLVFRQPGFARSLTA